VAQRDTRRERLVARVLVALGVFGVLAIVGLVAETAETGWNWHKIRAGLRFPAPVGRKDVHVSGCDHAFLDEPSPLDAGSTKAVPHYMLYCGVEGTTKPLPTCDEIYRTLRRCQRTAADRSSCKRVARETSQIMRRDVRGGRHPEVDEDR
jgi:hypothetical protein